MMGVRKETSGLTLIELMVVVIIVAIIAGLAVPNYSKMVERTKVKDAQGTLNIIYRAEGMYKLSYLGYGTRTQLVAGSYLYPDPSNDANWTFSTSGVTATAFTATATRKAGAGDFSEKTVSLDKDWTGDAVYSENTKKYLGDHPLHD